MVLNPEKNRGTKSTCKKTKMPGFSQYLNLYFSTGTCAAASFGDSNTQPGSRALSVEYMGCDVYQTGGPETSGMQTSLLERLLLWLRALDSERLELQFQLCFHVIG
jgi:hypothetical protein